MAFKKQKESNELKSHDITLKYRTVIGIFWGKKSNFLFAVNFSSFKSTAENLTDTNANANVNTASDLFQAQQNCLHLPVIRVNKKSCSTAGIRLQTHDTGP